MRHKQAAVFHLHIPERVTGTGMGTGDEFHAKQ